MSLAVTVGTGGLAGWNILKRTADSQRQAVAKDPVVARAIDYTRDRIATADADTLVGDYRMLSVALGAFGLEDDIGNKAFIRKVLESDRSDDKSLVNRLSDKRYRRLADALQLDNGLEKVSAPGFADKLAGLYVEREFERRVGAGDENLRLALNARRELVALSKRESSEKTLWYEVMGNPPLRKLFETAFGFGTHYAKLPIDRQLQEFMSRADQVLGTTSFKGYDTEQGSEKLIRTFLVRAQLAETAVSQSPYSNALTLLRGY